jgi:hypothetical protein
MAVAYYFQPLIPMQRVPNSQTVLYTGQATATRIDKLTVVNTDTVLHTISINIIPSGGSAGAGNLSTDAQVILPGQTWNSPNEVGLMLNIGDEISVIGSAATELNIIASGMIMTT